MLWIIIIIFCVAIGAALVAFIMSQVEQAKYTVVEKHGHVEIRDYASLIVAQVEVSGDRQEAINQGFRMLADYIFGNNIATQNVKMTTPVTQQPSEKIAMTAPITQTMEGKSWVVRFFMPASYTLQTLPKPNNDAIKIKEVSKTRYVVITFSGTASAKNLSQNKEKLLSFINVNHLKVISQPIYAFFNPPWTLPFLRRNEVMVEISH